MAAPFAAAGNRLCDNKINLIFPTELATGTIVEATSELLERTKYNTIIAETKIKSRYKYSILLQHTGEKGNILKVA